MTTESVDPLGAIDGDAHRALGAALFNRVWTLLEKPDRTTDEVDEMIHAVHASCFHWSLAEGVEPMNRARGEWQCSRVYAVLGQVEPARWHAQRCLDIVEVNAVGDFDRAAAYEALARASAIAGDTTVTADWKAKAAALVVGIDDSEDRQVIEDDLATLP